MSRRITSVLCLLCACTIGGGKAVLPGSGAIVEPAHDGGDAAAPDASGPSPGDGNDTPRHDAGDGDGTMSLPDGGDGDADGDSSTPLPLPPNCTQMQNGAHAYLFCTDSMWWDAARATCQGAGYDLVVIESQEENDFVKASITAESWIGLNDLDTEGTLVWIEPGESAVTGAVRSFETWFFTNPDDCVGLGDQDCVHIRPDGLWDDMACNETQGCPLVTGTRQFVCESY